jgi:hypothetical protein
VWIAAATAAVSASERSPLQTVRLMHDALREADRAKAESVLHTQYRGVSLQGPATSRHVFVETRERAVETIDTLRPGSWDVRILRATERIDRNGMAHVWARYVFYLDGSPHHCGYESYVLFRSVDGWKIVAFADTDTPLHGRSRSAVCPD